MAYQPQGVNFDGTNDFLTRGADLTDNADSKLLTIAGWIRTSITTSKFIAANANNRYRLRLASGIMEVRGINATGTIILSRSMASSLANGAWRHFMFSANLGTAGAFHFYLDDEDADSGSGTHTDDSIDFTDTEHAIGGTTLGGALLNGDLADFWFGPGQYVDLSVEANRRKFVGEGAATSVDLGSDGSTPTGTAPIIYLSGATSTWHTNDGTGEGFTENGELTDASENPPADVLAGRGGGNTSRRRRRRRRAIHAPGHIWPFLG